MKTDNPEEELDQGIIQIVAETKPQDVQQLIKLTQIKYPLPEKQILNRILALQDKGKIQLKTSTPAPNEKLADYLRSGQATWYWITLVLTVASIAVASTVPEDAVPYVYARYVLGAIFVLWLPGYAFIKALFPAQPSAKKPEKNLDPVERVALSMGMSLALVPITGLLLNYSPWGIRFTPIVLSLTALTLVFATAALLRENQTRNKQTQE